VKVGVNLLWLVPGDVGGTEEYAVRLLSHLARSGAIGDDLDVTVFASRATLEAHGFLRSAFGVVEAPVGRHRPGRVLLESTWLAAATRRAGLDLVHHLGGTVPFVQGAPSVVTIHDLHPLRHPETFGPIKRRWMRAVLPHAARKARLVVAISPFTARDLHERLGVPEGRIRIVRHGVDLPSRPVDPADVAAARDRYRLGAHWFVYPAVTWRYKNHLTLVRAFGPIAAADPDVALVLTGAEAEGEDELRAEIGRLGLEDRVRRTGRIPRTDLDAIISGATAVAVPSTFEGFGAPAVEGMALGAPVIASACAALPDVTGDAAILLDPFDVRAWTDAMCSLLQDPERRRALVEAGHRRAAELSWDEPVAALVGTWRDAIGMAA
jgi:alpha-1,3-rhamnosyl/mannosyltransferase